MKLALKTLSVIVTAFLLISFTDVTSNNFIGTYGVSGSDPSDIKLTIHADHTYTYQDFSDSKNTISVSGNWTIKGKKVLLENSDPGKKFHTVWSFTDNGQVAKSRKGLLFYRLCRLGN